MMVMTAKVDMKKILLSLAAVGALVLSLILLLGGGKDPAAQTGAPAVGSNDQRVKFLTDLGWQVTTSPMESGQVKIPEASTEVFDRYNTLQKGQGYDLSKFAGKKVMRYVYKVNNFPGAGTEPVYATLLVYKNEIIGGDVTDTAPGGKIQGLKTAPAPAASNSGGSSPSSTPGTPGATVPVPAPSLETAPAPVPQV